MTIHLSISTAPKIDPRKATYQTHSLEISVQSSLPLLLCLSKKHLKYNNGNNASRGPSHPSQSLNYLPKISNPDLTLLRPMIKLFGNLLNTNLPHDLLCTRGRGHVTTAEGGTLLQQTWDEGACAGRVLPHHT